MRNDWPTTPKEAIALQRQMASLVVMCAPPALVKRVAGVDVGFENHGQITRAAVALLSFPELELVEWEIARLPTVFPYIPGLLSFRELPAVLVALEQMHQRPDLVLVDGQGLAHPRRFGIACHLGVLTDLVCIGVGKSRLVGQTRHDVGLEKGAWQWLWDRDELVGALVRTRDRVKPVYVSPGHRIDMEGAIHQVLACTRRYRLPEPIRWAHRLASGLIEPT